MIGEVEELAEEPRAAREGDVLPCPGPDPESTAPVGPAPPRVAPGALTSLLRELAATPDPQAPLDASVEGLAAGDVVADRFELEREIGRGGFGVVLEAWDRQLSRRVALKVLRPSRRTRAEVEQCLLRDEAEVAGRLQHPNIVTVFDVGSCQAGPFLILELLRGGTLAARLQHGPLPVREAVRIAVEMARGLEHAHHAGVVHRDVKPSNVFVCEDGSVKLLDFGVAVALGAGHRGSAGTPGYMAPEVLRGGRGDRRTDVFGLGAVLYEMLTGRLPYPSRRGQSTALAPGPGPSLDAPGVRAPLADLVAEMLSKDPAARPGDGGAVLDRLLEVERQIVALREDEAFEARYLHWRRAHLIAAAALALHLPLDLLQPRGRLVAALRALWIALTLVTAPFIHPRRPRFSLAALHFNLVASMAAASAIIALCGGSASVRFGFLLAMPPMLLGLIPEMPLAIVLTGASALAGGVAILVSEGRSAFAVAEWASLSLVITAFAVVGSVVIRRTILGELGARQARTLARSAARRSRGSSHAGPAEPASEERVTERATG